MTLCTCVTFTDKTWLLDPNGHCRYCGGFIWPVFKKLQGDAKMQEAIDDLEGWKRRKMREIIATIDGVIIREENRPKLLGVQ